jgi:hypothetical protein
MYIFESILPKNLKTSGEQTAQYRSYATYLSIAIRRGTALPCPISDILCGSALGSDATIGGEQLSGNRYGEVPQAVDEDGEKSGEPSPTALEQVKGSARTVIVGLPGAGKSTFFEWLQVKLASVEDRKAARRTYGCSGT